MSKKNSKTQQQKHEEPIDLPNLKVAQTVSVVLPKGIALKQQNNPLLQGYLRAKLNNKKIYAGQNFVALFKGREQTFVISEVDGIRPQSNTEHQKQEDKVPKSERSFIVNSTTQIKLIELKEEEKIQKRQLKTSFFGYQEEIKDLQTSIIHSLFNRQVLINNGLGPLRGILVGGYSGAGKSALLKQVKNILLSQHSTIHWRQISSVEMLSRVVGGAQQFIRGIFNDLKKNRPCVLAIEDIHLLFGAKQVSSHETALATLLAEMQKAEWEEIVVVATYNTERQLAKSIRSSGKFEKEVLVGLPNHVMRLEILQKMLNRLSLKEEIDIQALKKINLRLNGFTIGEVKQILREAFSSWGQSLTGDNLEQLLKKYRPSQIKQLIVEVPQVFWSQIGGYEDVKKQIRKVVELPLQHSAKFAKFGIQPSKGILLYGPPGCSKTMMAKAIATESKLNFIGIKGPELFSKYVGESQRAIRNIFKRARACSPCVIFFDEIDAIATQRSGNTEVSERVLCQLLNEMDGIEGLKEVAIVAATNRPEILDKALMRPGRFDYLIYISPPDETARTEIFSIYLKKSITPDKVKEFSELMAKKTQNYTGAELSLICREAVVMALEENIECETIQLEHLQKSLKRFKKRLTSFEISKYEQFSKSQKQGYN